MKILLFPGQGSQFVGMGKDLCAQSQLCEQLYRRADEVLGRAISSICFDGPEEELLQTVNTQPALYLMSAALVTLMREEGFTPDAVAGHSVGEYPALYAAGCFDFETGLRLIQARANAMHAAGQQSEGGMAAVLNLSAEDVAAACRDIAAATSQPIGVAGINTPAQVVISGARAAIDQAPTVMKQYGARRVVPLNVGDAYHSPLMAPAVTEFEAALAEVTINRPEALYISNYDALPQDDPETIKHHLAQQLQNPVRWVASIEYLREQGELHCWEVGSGSVVTGMLKKFDPPLACSPVNNVDAARQVAQGA